jgi:predicted house-cleaning NTP pyrophosphatase (Maf/HAM1 superfamily)
MALPSLNASPAYELSVPSTGKKYKFRPFLVKEQKVLMLAYESQDKKQIINAMLETISSCVDEINPKTLTTSDVDYIFTQLRAKSVGEKIELTIKCDQCETYNPITVDVEKVKVNGNTKEKVVKLSEDISIKLKYPTYYDFMTNLDVENKTHTDTIMDVVVSCIDSIMTEEDNISAKDEPREEVIKFVESMNSKQFEMISDFVQEIPQLEYNTGFTCTNCSYEQNVKLQGLDDFF